MIRLNSNSQTNKMYRNSRSSWRQPSPSRMAMTGFDTRTPLYPIGPTMTQAGNYQPIYGGPNFPRPMSPYLHPKPVTPSYQNKLLQRQSRISQNPNYEQRQRKLLALNESQIEGEARRRQSMRASYQREISRLTTILSKNLERKQHLKSQLETLTADSDILKGKLNELKPPSLPNNLSQGLERKQEEIIRLKTQMINEVRQKEEELVKERDTEMHDWEARVNEKEKILAAADVRKNFAKGELIKARRGDVGGRLVVSQVEEAAREKAHQEFHYDFEKIREKINQIQLQREQSLRDTTQSKYLKSGVIRDQQNRIQDLRKQLTHLQISLVEIQNRNKQIQKANQNLEQQTLRKDKLIEQYETDIKDLKYIITKKQGEFSAAVNGFRERHEEYGVGLEEEIEGMEKAVREVQSENFRLKADYKRLTDLLSSSVSKSIYQTFNDMRFNH